ncbi:MAG: hypothetical protein A2V67_19690 [Deltaproteobacteria bacterium RBG_13_61_14]|nr:MAG: hypothetical protein A2V67_19690 [Deltaproteobacteria bacterium RBG_13_61_14]
MNTKVKALGILAGCGLALAWAGAVRAQELRLEDLIQEALAHNPELQARAEEWSAAKEQVPQAGALPDPMLTLGVMSLPVDSWSFNREPMTQKTVEVSQAFPFPGKRPLLTEAKKAERDAAESKLRALQNQVTCEVRQAYAELYYLDHALEVTRQNQELLRQFIQVAGALYAVGKGLQQDVLKAQVELSMLLDQEIMLTQDRKMAAANLNRLLGRDPSAALESARRLDLEPLPADAKALAEKAAAANPELAEADRMVAESQALARLAQRSYYPDFTVMLGYGFREDVTMAGNRVEQSDLVSGSVGFNLPIYSFRKQSKQAAEGRARVQERRHEREDRAWRVREEVAATYAQAERAWRQIQLYQGGIIPQSENSLKSAMAGYQVNKVDFLTLLDSQKTLYDLEIRLRRRQADYSRAIARLDELSARPVAEIVQSAAGLKLETPEK